MAHILPKWSNFKLLHPILPYSVSGVGGPCIHVLEIETIEVCISVGHKFQLNDVLFILALTIHLVSVLTLNHSGHFTLHLSENNFWLISPNGATILHSVVYENCQLYSLLFFFCFFFLFFFKSLFIVFMCGHYKTVRTSYSKDWCRPCAEVISGKVTTVKRITFRKDSKGSPKGWRPKGRRREYFTHNHKASAHQVDSRSLLQLRSCVLHGDKLDTASVPTQAMRKWRIKRKGEGGGTICHV